MTARTPIERGAEAVYQRYDQVNTLTAPNIARAVLGAALDVDELAAHLCKAVTGKEWGRPHPAAAKPWRDAATAIRAYLLSDEEGAL